MPSQHAGYEIPKRMTPADDRGYLEQMTKAIFQAGFSWQVVKDKWENMCRAFVDFDIRQLANFDIEDIDRLLADPRIIRNGRKITATINNANKFRHIIATYGTFAAYLRSLERLDYREKQKTLSREFAHLGRTGVYVFLWCVNEEVPSWEER